MNNILFKYKSKIRNSIYHFKIANNRILKNYSNKIGLRRIPWVSLLISSWKYGANFNDYFEFNFFELNDEDRRNHLTTSLRHEFTTYVNNPQKVNIFKDKLLFSKQFSIFVGRNICSYTDIKNLDDTLIIDPLVIKPRFGQSGREILFTENQMTAKYLKKLAKDLKTNDDNYVYEEHVNNQHIVLKRIAPKSLNTIRIVTYYNGEQVERWSSFIRFGVDSRIDNLLAGGISAKIDDDGVVRTPAISYNPFDPKYFIHPISRYSIINIKIPYWNEILILVERIAKIIPDVKSIGWDIAVTDSGPILIEGNDNWSNKCDLFSGNISNRIKDIMDNDLIYLKKN